MDSKHRRLAERLGARLESVDSKKRFEETGFVWKAEKK
jgi:hypothetical protein